jgi:hypothetical protein
MPFSAEDMGGPGDRRIMAGLDLAEVAVRQAQKQRPHDEPVTVASAEIIFAAVERLLPADRGEEGLGLALALAPLAIGMPHSDKTAVIDKLIRSPAPILNKWRLYAALISPGW